DLAATRGAGKRSLDRRRRFALVEAVDGRIGIVDPHARLGKQPCGGRFAHGDRSGEAEDENNAARVLARMSASMTARSAGVTAGVTPNQRANAGTAWCSSMPRPSTAR